MKLPVGVSSLTNAMDACGWTHTVTHGSGHMDVQAFGAPRGDGTRPKLTVAAPCRSIAVRAVHEATGRQVRALWVQREGWVCTTRLGVRWWKTTKTKKGTRTPLLVLADPAAVALVSVALRWGLRSYAFEMAWRGRHDGEHTPRELDATEAKAYVIDVQLEATDEEAA